MTWSYKTVHFELKKEGLLGAGVLDESEIERALNEFGRSGWELISVLEVQDGIITFFKQPLGMESGYQYHQEEADDSFQETESVSSRYDEQLLGDQEVERTPSRHDEDLVDDLQDATEISSEKDSSQNKNVIGAIKIE